MEEKPEAARVERGPITEVPHFALGMAALLERQGFTVAAAELRRLHALNTELLDALRRVMRHIPADAGGASLSDDMHRARKAIAQAED